MSWNATEAKYWESFVVIVRLYNAPDVHNSSFILVGWAHEVQAVL